MVKDIPKWLDPYFKESDLKKIEAAVAHAESNTSGEIVPVIVRSSWYTAHVGVILFFVLTTIYFAENSYQDLGDYFEFDWHWSLHLVAIVLFAMTSKLLSGSRKLKSMLTFSEEVEEQISMRAQFEFFQSKVHQTKSQTGILIFLSLEERKVVVLGDKGISDVLPQNTWAEVVDLVIGGAKAKDLGGGMIKAIDKCGELLAEKFPIQDDDQNELHDHLIIKE